MCGFIISINEQKLFKQSKKKLRLTTHRGPDNQKFYYDENISILFRRLSIIDLSKKSDQPIISENKQFILVFNGEIYNFKNLREDLTEKGIKFKSDGEAEVLLNGFIYYGDDFIEKIRGMFSICIWDRIRQKLTSFRDRFGQKPLFYLKTTNGIIFSSEIKDINTIIQCSENVETSKRYVYRGFLDNNRNTFFKNIKRVLPSEKIIFFKNRIVRQFYWKQKIFENKKFDKNEFLTLYLENLNLHLNADVKLAFLLSGGLDSSSLVSGAIKLNKNIKAFSILPKNTINEKPFIDSFINENSISHEYINVDSCLSRKCFEKVLFYQDEPIQGINCLHQFYLKEKIKSKGYRVLITGDGGDEMLGGYDRMFEIYLDYLIKTNKKQLFNEICKLRNLDTKIVLNKIKKFNNRVKRQSSDIEDNTFNRYINKKFLKSNNKIFDEKWNELNQKSDKNFFKKTLINSLFTNDLQMSLRMADRNAMASSIENRAPFLDHRFSDYIFSIKTEDFYTNGISKGMLRSSISKISNKKIVNRKTKSGRPGNDIYFIFYVVFEELIDLINIFNVDLFGFDKNSLLKDIFKIKKYFLRNINNLDRSIRQQAFFYFRLYCYFKWKEQQKIV